MHDHRPGESEASSQTFFTLDRIEGVNLEMEKKEGHEDGPKRRQERKKKENKSSKKFA